VRHLEYWYAQSHPDEDFAETFAVWLRPRSDWRTRYGNWPALKKLEYVDELMQEIAGKKPLMRTRTRIETLRSIKKTLREYYERKLRGYNGGYSRAYDADLKNLFSEKRGKGQKAASAAIRRIRPEVMRVVSPWIGEDRYLLDHLLKEIVGRCRELNLAVQGGESRLKRNFALFLTKHAVNALYRKRGWVEM
jgi:ribosomal protein L20A (L18A)